MNRFWGMNANGNSQRLSRGDDQLLSLNYENLCDGDYLSRLFSSAGGPVGGDATAASAGAGAAAPAAADGAGAAPSSSQHAHMKDNESWILAGDTAEDIVLFGDDSNLGKDLLQKRFLRGLSAVNGNQDALSVLVQRQIVVFDNIGRLVAAKCAEADTPGTAAAAAVVAAALVANSNSNGSGSGSPRRPHLASEALLCSLKALRLHSKHQLQRSSVEPILALLVNVHQERAASLNPQTGDKDKQQQQLLFYVHEEHFHCLRDILSNGVLHGTESFAAFSVGLKLKEKEEQFRLSLSCAYGYLATQLYTKSVGDLLMAVCHLMTIAILLEEWREQTVAEQELESDIQVAMSMGRDDYHALHDAVGTGAGTGLRAQNNADSPSSLDVIEAQQQKASLKMRLKMKGKPDAGNSTAGPSFPAITSGGPKAGGPAGHQKASAGSNAGSAASSSGNNERSPVQDSKTTGIKSSGGKWEKPSKATGPIPQPQPQSAKDVQKMKLQLARSRATFADVDDEEGADMFAMAAYMHASSPAARRAEKGRYQRSQSTPTTAEKSLHPAVSINNNEDNVDVDLHAPPPGPLELVPSRGRKDPTRAFRACFRNLHRVPRSVLRIVHDTFLDPVNGAASAAAAIGGGGGGSLGSPALLVCSSPSSAAYRSLIASKSHVWSCGQNTYGELGQGDCTLRKNFTKVSFLEGKGIVSVGAGNEHTVFVCEDGKVFVTGYNDNGQCGLGHTEQLKQPQQVVALEGEDIAQVFVYNGCEHSLAVTRDGKLYSFGYNYRGQLGHGSTTIESVPRLVKGLLSRKVVLAACSYHHSVMLCADGALFSCGRNDVGQLGHGDTIDKKSPQQVQTVAPARDGAITGISCGQFHTVVITASGAAYAAGKNDYGQIGLEGPDSVKVFTKIPGAPEGDGIKQASCGYYHTLFLTQNGIVLGTGRNDYGQLGLGHAQARVFGCHVVAYLRDKNVVSIAAGCYHSVSVTGNGMLYFFGRNNHGQLATGDADDRHVPHPVDDFVGCRAVSVAAGFYHTVVVAVDASVDSAALLDGLEDPDPLVRAVAPRPPSVPMTTGAGQKPHPADGHAHAPGRSAVPAGNPGRPDPPRTHPAAPSSSSRAVELHDALFAELSDPVTAGGEQEPRKPSRRAGGFSMEHASKSATLKDLLALLVHQLEVAVTAGHPHPLPARAQKKCPGPGGEGLGLGDRDEVHLAWLTKQASAMALFIAVARDALGPHAAAPLPVGAEDTDSLLRTLLRTADYFLRLHRAPLLDALAALASEPDEYYTSEAFSASLQPRARHLGALDIIQQLRDGCDSGGIGGIGATAGVGAAGDGPALRAALGRLRRELLVTYFCFNVAAPPAAGNNGPGGAPTSATDADWRQSQLLVSECGACLSRHFEVLFATDAARTNFVSMLSQILTARVPEEAVGRRAKSPVSEPISPEKVDGASGASDVPEVEYVRCLRLFTRMCARYRNINEAMKLFTPPRRRHGLGLFRQLLAVYSHLSLYSLEHRAQIAGVSVHSGDVCRALATLEQCNASLVKCAIPLVLGNDGNGNGVGGDGESERDPGASEWRAFGTTIIREIFATAESVLDLLAAQSLTDDVMNLLRYGTVIPSVLPTILLYGIVHARACGCVQQLLPLSRSLTKKLQALGVPARFEGDSPSASPHKPPVAHHGLGPGPAAGPSPSPSNRGLGGTLTGARAQRNPPPMSPMGRDDPAGARSPSPVALPSGAPTLAALGSSKSHAPASAPGGLDRDLAQLTWWSRLLKLATVLNARLAAALVFDGPVGEAAAAAAAAAGDAGPRLDRHGLWTYVSCPHSLDAHAALSRKADPSTTPDKAPRLLAPLADGSSGRSSSGSSGGSGDIDIVELARELRDREAAIDSAYRMILQVNPSTPLRLPSPVSLLMHLLRTYNVSSSVTFIHDLLSALGGAQLDRGSGPRVRHRDEPIRGGDARAAAVPHAPPRCAAPGSPAARRRRVDGHRAIHEEAARAAVGAAAGRGRGLAGRAGRGPSGGGGGVWGCPLRAAAERPRRAAVHPRPKDAALPLAQARRRRGRQPRPLARRRRALAQEQRRRRGGLCLRSRGRRHCRPHRRQRRVPPRPTRRPVGPPRGHAACGHRQRGALCRGRGHGGGRDARNAVQHDEVRHSLGPGGGVARSHARG